MKNLNIPSGYILSAENHKKAGRYTAAFKDLQIAANMNDKIGASGLGQCYLLGQGVTE